MPWYIHTLIWSLAALLLWQWFDTRTWRTRALDAEARLAYIERDIKEDTCTIWEGDNKWWYCPDNENYPKDATAFNTFHEAVDAARAAREEK